MTRKEHLLVTFAEECAEVIKEVSKALRFGLDDHAPDTTETNRERITNEFNDLFAVMVMLQDEGVIKEKDLLTTEAIEAKRKKVEHFMQYSKITNK